MRARKEDQDLRSIAEWLTPINYAVQQSDLVSRRHKEAGIWLLESEEFQHWLTQPLEYPTLFCPGIPGAGKTVITSIVISYLQDRFQQDNSVGLAHIFCDFRQQDIQNPTALVASLLRQLARGQHAEPLRALYKKSQFEQSYPSQPDLVNTLRTVVSSYSRVIILIDALDEFQALEGRETFLREPFTLQENAEMNVSIFATSRYGEIIEAFFENSLKRPIHANEADVRNYLDDKLEKFQPWVAKNHSLKEDIKAKISEAVDGM